MYDAYPASLAGLVGQDIVTLAVGLPLLLGAMWLATRGSAAGILLWAGALFYLAYSYYFFLIGGFNALPLVYTAIVATSLYALLALLLRIDAEALRTQFADRAPVRSVATFFVVTALLFAVMWGDLSLASALTGTTPGPVVHLVVATYAAYAGGWAIPVVDDARGATLLIGIVGLTMRVVGGSGSTIASRNAFTVPASVLGGVAPLLIIAGLIAGW